MRKIKTLIRKELMDILRDKKTLILMVVVPVLLYPLILIGMSLVMVNVMQSQETEVHTVGYAAAYAGAAAELERLQAKPNGRGQEKDQQPREGAETDAAVLEFLPAQTGQEAEVKETADVWLDFSTREDGTLYVSVEYVSTDQSSRYAKEELEELLEAYRQELLLEKLGQEGLEESFLYPLVYEAQDGASATESMGMDIGGSIGMLLIITILLGAVYPSIDATAGEKERGTLETLLTLPVSNFQMILSKYVSVALLASVTAILSVLSLGGSVWFLMFGLSPELAGEMEGLSAMGILSAAPVLLLTLLVTAFLAAALCMTFCVFARSFKEANNYITPVLLVVMFAAMAGMVPTVQLDYRTAMIPIVNVSLMVKQVISGQFHLVLAGITICVNLACSILIIWVLAKMYDSENILFADGFRSFRIFQKRSEIAPGTVPDGGDLVISITLLFLLLIYAGSAASLRLGFWGTAVSQLLILLVPLAVTWYMKTDVKQLFSLRKPVWSSLPGALLLYAGTWCLVMALSMLLTVLLPGSARNVEEAFMPMAEQPLWAVLLVLAVMPGIGEEILFRGFLFGSLREKFSYKGRTEEKKESLRGVALAILITSLVFGLFHMSLIKLLPTALLGVSFAWLVYRTGSIGVSMCCHFLNNAASMLVLKYPEEAGRLVPFLTKEVMTWQELAILTAVGVVAAALGLLWLKKFGVK